jgi:hypothetical protein
MDQPTPITDLHKILDNLVCVTGGSSSVLDCLREHVPEFIPSRSFKTMHYKWSVVKQDWVLYMTTYNGKPRQ